MKWAFSVASTAWINILILNKGYWNTPFISNCTINAVSFITHNGAPTITHRSMFQHCVIHNLMMMAKVLLWSSNSIRLISWYFFDICLKGMPQLTKMRFVPLYRVNPMHRNTSSYLNLSSYSIGKSVKLNLSLLTNKRVLQQ